MTLAMMHNCPAWLCLAAKILALLLDPSPCVEVLHGGLAYAISPSVGPPDAPEANPPPPTPTKHDWITPPSKARAVHSSLCTWSTRLISMTTHRCVMEKSLGLLESGVMRDRHQRLGRRELV
ncbi:uncharacterized protein K489DRAFT_47902 [Dissoconium aciculare CBS 342.82]|uniref:Secreted protein n=1 Tax=Dissoconium aciculare CBS 342.82 TaxID=1314786 RepID=A0A6J3LWK9_9PEZI|nr:uncharacterized protein K489DRAFT_47902 [Dissoconium aciculare CBS 342.82]KAF1820150.1 hypothetical protein K489DRAFT_47902 [Dissoconium aciculare CBS 342.82]